MIRAPDTGQAHRDILQATVAFPAPMAEGDPLRDDRAVAKCGDHPVHY
jgi:hypothetical protein